MSDSDNNFQIYVDKNLETDLRCGYRSPSPIKKQLQQIELIEKNLESDYEKEQLSDSTICLGSFIKNLSNVILYYMTIDIMLKSHGVKLQELVGKIKKANKLDSNYKNSYMEIIQNLREEYLKFMESGLIKIDDGWIDGTEHCIKFKNGRKNAIVNIIPFLPIYYLTEANKNKDILYFKRSPRSTSYGSNKKILFKDIKPDRTLYPVWFYKVGNRLDDDYSSMIKQIKDSHNGYELYTNLLDYRATLNKSIVMGNRNTVDALGKYKFVYANDKSYLYDPKNPKMLISPRKQGVIDGYYSFAESIDIYKTPKESILAIRNTLLVIEKIRHALGLYVAELEAQKKLILK